MTSENTNNSPLEIKELEPKLAQELMKNFPGDKNGFILVGSIKCFLPHKYKQMASDIYNMTLRSDDVFVATYPRSGTTWTQELVWMVANDLDYETAAAIPLTRRYPFLEVSMYSDTESERKMEGIKLPGIEHVAAIPSPRFIKTHLPFSLLPPTLLDTAKVVYVARDPRDVIVSYYTFYKSIGWYVGDLKTYWNYFIRDMQHYSPFFGHLKEAWEKRNHPNLLFLFYEDLCKDLPAQVHRVATFLNKKYSEEQVAKLCDHLSIDKFKKNKSVNNALKEIGLDVNPEQGIIRKGKAGGWRDYFDADMTREADNWIADNLKDTDFRFPHFTA